MLRMILMCCVTCLRGLHYILGLVVMEPDFGDQAVKGGRVGGEDVIHTQPVHLW
jgi:hypothetical protein